MPERLYLKINMEKNKNKKKTLTISTSFNKKKVSQPSFQKPEKKAFFPDRKKSGKPIPKNRNFFNQPSNNKGGLNRKNFARKFAEQQATKRFIHPEEKKFDKNKTKNLKPDGVGREHKLTLSRAMNVEEFDIKQRSLASVKRARLKDKKNKPETEEKKEFKKVIREVNIPEQISKQIYYH